MSTVPAQSHYVVRDAVRLHHLDWGNHGRHPVVLVHGSRLHAHVWNDYSRRAKDGYHVIAVDQRGHGDSGWGAPEAYHYEELYRDLRTVIEARGLKRYTLVGHSLGGMVSMLYAHRHHDELERLVLVDIAAGLPPAPPDTDFSRVAEVPSPRDFESHDEAADYLAGIMRRAPRHMVEESVRHGMRQGESGRHTWKYDPALAHMRRPNREGIDFWSLVKDIPTRTLLQYGSESRVVTEEIARRMAETMPDCRIERIDNAGHALFTDQPDAFAASMERFLADAKASGT